MSLSHYETDGEKSNYMVANVAGRLSEPPRVFYDYNLIQPHQQMRKFQRD